MGGGPGADDSRASSGTEQPAAPTLARVLSVATLTPGQAALLISDLLAEAGNGHAEKEPSLRSIRLSLDGSLIGPFARPEQGNRDAAGNRQPQLEPASAQASAGQRGVNGVNGVNGAARTVRGLVYAPADSQGNGHREVPPAVAGIARRLVDSTRDSPSYAAAADALDAELGSVLQSAPGAGDRILTLAHTKLGVTDPRAVRAELATIAQAAHRAFPVAPAELPANDVHETHEAAVSTVSRTPGPQEAEQSGLVYKPQRVPFWRRDKVWHRKFRVPSRRLIVLTVLVVALAGAGVVTIPRVVADLQGTWDTLMNPQPPDQQLAPVSPPEEQDAGLPLEPIPELAPASAGEVARISASLADGQCVPGRPCNVRVDVQFAAGAVPEVSSWTLHVADRCTGEVVEHPGLAMPVQEGSRQSYGVSEIPLESSPAMAIIAMTIAPAQAASEPILVPADGGAC
ncbi:hypothetical protein ONR57_11200 [Hoyosella sp. YIM 151337]|uniref:hypothetical protein n=1 Tax=Hoyosella sp. YIM 151337 TaxID=2992742 RepID=UPI002235D7E0|nr:hypothetical protein [Hoyosella sp. YIM 151337]MCW4353864.1 hypothetical protein [Hoyosella sp. YIM 151337]